MQENDTHTNFQADRGQPGVNLNKSLSEDETPSQQFVAGFELVEAIRKRLAEICATVEQPMPGGSAELDAALVEQKKLDDAALLKIYSDASLIPVLDEHELGDFSAFPDVPYDYLNAESCLPIEWTTSRTTIALATPYNAGNVAHAWKSLYDTEPQFVLARKQFIDRFITALYDNPDDMAQVFDGDSEQALRDLAKEAPIVRLVNDVFARAQEMGASDIHVEPAEHELAIRFRVDGLLQTVFRPPKNQYPAIASRIKLLAGMNIAEHRLPQDGRIELNNSTNPLDIRVSTVPCMHGESIVLRLLQKDQGVFDLDKVGLLDDNRQQLETLFNMPHGMILIVGPTGSGKTTTLYCIMRILNADYRKIITIEDPVEYQLDGLTQIHVKANIGLTFASGLRAIVRQDPDVILVGEIRDKETAEIAIHAALTGHLVLSTLHTNDSAGAVARLCEMGVEPFLITSALLGVASQRLVRRICPACGGTGQPQDGTSRRCRTCSGSGYKGRIAIFELMLINEALRHAINERKDSAELIAIARQNGMRTLKEDGDLKVKLKLTTASEVTRVCQLDVGDI